MSLSPQLAELTRRSFQNGVSTQMWVKLCLLMKEYHPAVTTWDFESDISNSILTLFHSYPAHPSLLAYIKRALHGDLLTLPAFVVAFLQAAKSPNLHDAATLDAICRLIQEERYASGLPPIGSLVRYGESTITVLATVQDGLTLLRTAYSLPMSPFHALTTSASELVILLLSCVGDMSQVSTAQAMVHLEDVHDMLQSLRLHGDVRPVLENFALSLSILLGDDAKMAQEAQMMQTLQLALRKGDILGPDSESDIVTCSLLLRYLVGSKVSLFGSGNTPLAVAMIVATFRGTSWSPAAFYTQLLISAMSCLAQGNNHQKTSMLWKSFIMARLPQLLVMFEVVVSSEALVDTDWRAATQAAITALCQRSDLLEQCDVPRPSLPEDVANVAHPDFGRPYQQNQQKNNSTFFSCLLHYYAVRAKILDAGFVRGIDPSLSGPFQCRLETEVENGMELDAYIDSKLSPDVNVDESLEFLRRAAPDFPSHQLLAQVIQNRFASLTQNFDVDGLSHLCRILYLSDTTLDIISLHVRIATIIAHTLAFVEDYDCESVGDPQTAVSHLGDVVMFLQSSIVRFQMSSYSFTLGDRTLQARFLLSTSTVYSLAELSGDDLQAFLAWSKALFDSSSEGIEDNILRATNPKKLLKLAPSLIFHAINACSEGIMDSDVMINGVSYFTGPLLNWTLAGVIKALLTKIHSDSNSPMHLGVLQTLVQSSSCPEPILCLSAHGILRLMRAQQSSQNATFSATTLRAIANRALGVTAEDSPDSGTQSLSLGSQLHWQDQPRRRILDALAATRAGKAPSLDLGRCITVAGPTGFLQLLWHGLSAAAQMGDMESCRRLAMFTLTCPPNGNGHSLPLLPIFLHNLLPTILPKIDRQMPPEQTMNIELLVVIISSSLTGVLQMEWAMRAIDCEPRHPAGQPSAAIARKLAISLRKNTSPTATIIMQRLSSSPSFVANFPAMVSG